MTSVHGPPDHKGPRGLQLGLCMLPNGMFTATQDEKHLPRSSSNVLGKHVPNIPVTESCRIEEANQKAVCRQLSSALKLERKENTVQ